MMGEDLPMNRCADFKPGGTHSTASLTSPEKMGTRWNASLPGSCSGSTSARMRRLQGAIAGACLLVSVGTVRAQSASYSIPLLPGWNSVANHLDHAGGNTLAQLFPAMPNGTRLYKFDHATQ